ncbi:MAG: DUF424 domain-containing protein [Candidatus Bilamarchaeaceae archaeon]
MHETKGGKIVAACDKELVGKVFEGTDGECIDLKTYKDFYVGGIATENEIREALKSFSSANLVGKHVVEIAVKEGIVSEECIRYINGIPHIQIYRV